MKILPHLLVALFWTLLTPGSNAQDSYPLRAAFYPSPEPLLENGLFGNSVAVDGDYLVVGAPGEYSSVPATRLVMVYRVSTRALVAILEHPDAVGASFGNAVAISGNRIVVGAADFSSRRTAVYVYDLASSTPTVPVLTLRSPSPQTNDGFGVSLAVSGSRIAVGASHDDTGGQSSGSVYLYDLESATPGVPVFTWRNPNPDIQDKFGSAVALSGRYMVVGCPFDRSGPSAWGSAYVYDLEGAAPTEPVATLNRPAAGGNEYFGGAVAISDSKIVVGASGADVDTADSGSAYVFDLRSGVPSEPVAVLRGPQPHSRDQFGWSVAIVGSRVAVGAPSDDTVGQDAGSAYIYDLEGGTPSVPIAILNNPSPESTYRPLYGFSVAVSNAHAAVGAPQDSTVAPRGGSAYLFEFASIPPTEPVARLNNPAPDVGDSFGCSVAVSGSRMVVGARFDDRGAENAGAVYVYDLDSERPTEPILLLLNPDPMADDSFGNSVGIFANYIVVGAFREDTGAANAGSVYVYDLSGANPTVPMLVLNNPSPQYLGSFGSSVAIRGTRLAVGAIGNSDRTGGSAYVYDLRSATPAVPVLSLPNPFPGDGDRFGNAMALSGRWLVVGAYLDDVNGYRDHGSAYVYDLGSTTPTIPIRAYHGSRRGHGNRFGSAVSIAGNRVAIGAPGRWGPGGAYVYDLADPSMKAMAQWERPMSSEGEIFGVGLAISGRRLVVGARSRSASGAAYVYELDGSKPETPVARLTSPSPSAHDGFGLGVVVSGRRVVVAAPADDTLNIDEGGVFVYDRVSPPTATPTSR